MLAGLPGAIGSVPDGMAASVLAGVSPIHGLYASFAGPIAGGAAASTPLMVITTTSAAALAAGSALEQVSPAERPEALFLLTMLAGALMIVAGLAKLGRYTRFVSHSVMTGFLTGVALNVALGQIPSLTGATAAGGLALTRAIDVLVHPSLVDGASLVFGLAAVAVVGISARTRLGSVGALLALVLPTAVALLVGAEGIASVSDSGSIPSGLPLPHLPHLGSVSAAVVTGAFAVAAIVLVQGAGVSESVDNPGGSLSDANRDFMAQGLGNAASGLFRGQPVGGSVGQSALNVAAGARSRWASIFSGLWMLLILVAFSGLVGKVLMPTLAAVLVYAAVSSLHLGEMLTILRTGASSAVAAAATFVATLTTPIPTAVAIGVALSLVLQLRLDAMDLSIVELVDQGDGSVGERPAPAQLASHEVTVLDVYGSLFYAGARTLEVRLPDPTGATAPVVVLRLRGRSLLGATFFVVVARYAARLQAVGGRLYLSGVDPKLHRQLRSALGVELSRPLQMFDATDRIGESTRAAVDDAETWLLGRVTEEGPPAGE